MIEYKITDEQFEKKEEFEQLGINFALELFDKFDFKQQYLGLKMAISILQDKWHGRILDLELGNESGSNLEQGIEIKEIAKMLSDLNL
jgi:hypothetical protein